MLLGRRRRRRIITDITANTTTTTTTTANPKSYATQAHARFGREKTRRRSSVEQG
jgi:hypothetical protein